MSSLFDLSAAEAAARIRWRDISPVELVRALLDRIDDLEPRIQAWETLDPEGALAAARRLEQELRRTAEPGLLYGVPVGVKDIYFTAGLRTTASFPPFRDFVPAVEATTVARLRQAGAITLGKTVTTQFAFIDPPRTRNPWNPDRTPGGSSSGSAAAVAARMVPAAVGSQTAGSILRPSAYCGVVGLKPTYGRVSRAGILPLAWSLDHPGPIVRTVEDAALLLQALAGFDPHDPTTSRRRVPDYRQATAVEGPAPRLGLVVEALERAQPEVRGHAEEVVHRLEAAGATVRPVELPSGLATVLAVHHVIMQVEAAAVHAGLLARHADAYGRRLRAYVEVGQLIPGWAYLQAQRLRRRIRDEVDRLLRGLDGLVLPTVSNEAPDSSSTGDASFQAPWSLLGLPAITLPTGLSPAGLPLGTQLVAACFRDDRLLRVARWCERTLGTIGAPDV